MKKEGRIMVEMPRQENKARLPPEPSRSEEKQELIERMKKRFKRHKRICMGLGFLTLTGLIILTMGCSLIPRVLYPSLFPLYVSIPIDLSRAGDSAETKLHILCEDVYKLFLRFYSTQESAFTDDKLQNFLRFGPVIPIRIKLVKFQGNEQIPIIDQIYMTYGAEAVSSESVRRDFAGISLQPGEYTLLVESVDGFPELTQTPVRVHMTYHWIK